MCTHSIPTIIHSTMRFCFSGCLKPWSSRINLITCSCNCFQKKHTCIYYVAILQSIDENIHVSTRIYMYLHKKKLIDYFIFWHWIINCRSKGLCCTIISHNSYVCIIINVCDTNVPPPCFPTYTCGINWCPNHTKD